MKPEPRTIAAMLASGDSSLLDLVDNVINKGIVLNADVLLGVANVDLIYLRLSALLCAADRVFDVEKPAVASAKRPSQAVSTPPKPRVRKPAPSLGAPGFGAPSLGAPSRGTPRGRVPSARRGTPSSKHGLPGHGVPSAKHAMPDAKRGTPSSNRGTPVGKHGTPAVNQPAPRVVAPRRPPSATRTKMSLPRRPPSATRTKMSLPRAKRGAPVRRPPSSRPKGPRRR